MIQCSGIVEVICGDNKITFQSIKKGEEIVSKINNFETNTSEMHRYFFYTRELNGSIKYISKISKTLDIHFRKDAIMVQTINIGNIGKLCILFCSFDSRTDNFIHEKTISETIDVGNKQIILETTEKKMISKTIEPYNDYIKYQK